MEVRYEMDHMGGVEMTPTAPMWQQLIHEYCKRMSIAGCPYWTGSVYANPGAEAEEALRDLGPRQRKCVVEGYVVYLRIDPWQWLHWVGYDAHTIAESYELKQDLLSESWEE